MVCGYVTCNGHVVAGVGRYVGVYVWMQVGYIL